MKFLYQILVVVTISLFASCSEDHLFDRKSYNLPDAPTHELTKIFEIEEAGEGNFFYGIMDIHFLSDGNLVVQNYPDQKLYELSPEGELINIIGRKGRGPGEFMDIYETELANDDTLHVFDFNYSRHQVLKKAPDGTWELERERVFKRIIANDMTEQVPNSIYPTAQGDFMGVFKISPGSNAIDTLTNYYKYTARVNHNLDQVSATTRLRPVKSLAIGKKAGTKITINNKRFAAAYYLYNPFHEEVIYVSNTSNVITAIDSLGHEKEKGRLPYEHFPVIREEINKDLDRISSNPYVNAPMEDLFMSKALKHEPYYRNITLHKNQLWVELAREDTTKPNWVVTTLSGEVLKSFIGPNNISGIKIHNDRMYGVEKSPDDIVSVVSYKLRKSH